MALADADNNFCFWWGWGVDGWVGLTLIDLCIDVINGGKVSIF